MRIGNPLPDKGDDVRFTGEKANRQSPFLRTLCQRSIASFRLSANGTSCLHSNTASTGWCHPAMYLLGGYPASINPNKPRAGPQFEGSKLYNRSTRLTTEFYDTSTGCGKRFLLPILP